MHCKNPIVQPYFFKTFRSLVTNQNRTFENERTHTHNLDSRLIESGLTLSHFQSIKRHEFSSGHNPTIDLSIRSKDR